MAGSQITLDTAQVLAIASQIEGDNKQLKELLDTSKATIDSLSASWTGAAAEESRSAYTAFANKFVQTYYDVLDQYVKFLRRNVAEQYEETEQANVRLADAFR